MPDGQRLFDAGWVSRQVTALVEMILKVNPSFERTAIVGIRTRGAILAARLAAEIHRRTGKQPPIGALDITLYRDDRHSTRHLPAVRGTDIPFNVDGTRILLVDDVLYTGRTVRAALDELLDFGRPERIELAVLIDRGCRELPIQPDFAAHRMEAPHEQFVRLHLAETDGTDEVILRK